MKEKNNDEQSFHEYEDEPNLHGMPETLSLLKNFRTKLKDNEIKRRELKKKVFESKSTQTVAQNFAQISPKMLLKLILIQMCMLGLVTIFVWYLSAFINGRKNDDLSNLILKEKLDELKDLQKEVKECRNTNEYLLNENRRIGQQIAALKPTASLIETWSWASSMISKWFSDFYSSLDATILELDNSLTTTESELLKLTVGVMNAFFAIFTVGVVIDLTPMRRSSSPMMLLVALPLWFSFTIMIHFLNSSVQISSLSTCASMVVMTIIMLILGALGFIR